MVTATLGCCGFCHEAPINGKPTSFNLSAKLVPCNWVVSIKSFTDSLGASVFVPDGRAGNAVTCRLGASDGGVDTRCIDSTSRPWTGPQINEGTIAKKVAIPKRTRPLL